MASRNRKLLLTAVIVVPSLLLVLTEIVLRIVNPNILDFAYNSRWVYQHHDRWSVDYIPNTSARIRLKDSRGNFFYNFLLTINEYGFRTRDRSSDNRLVYNPQDKIIHAIGDSFTMGWGVNHEASYPAILDSMLPGNYRVLNLGLNAYGVVAATEKSLHIAETFPPDIVVYLATQNDYKDDNLARSYASASYLTHRVNGIRNWFRRHTFLGSVPAALFWQVYYRDSINITDAEVVTEKPFHRFNNDSFGVIEYEGKSDPTFGQGSKQALLKYNDYLIDLGVPFIVIAHGVNKNTQDIFAFCREHSIHSYLVDVPQSFMLVRDGHFNHLGNYKMSDFVYEVLAAKDLID